MAVTIRDVAREAKVSVASVSRALNGNSNVTDSTRNRANPISFSAINAGLKFGHFSSGQHPQYSTTSEFFGNVEANFLSSANPCSVDPGP